MRPAAAAFTSGRESPPAPRAAVRSESGRIAHSARAGLLGQCSRPADLFGAGGACGVVTLMPRRLRPKGRGGRGHVRRAGPGRGAGAVGAGGGRGERVQRRDVLHRGLCRRRASSGRLRPNASDPPHPNLPQPSPPRFHPAQPTPVRSPRSPPPPRPPLSLSLRSALSLPTSPRSVQEVSG